MGSGDAYPTVLCSSGIKGCPPQVFQGSLCRTSLSDTAVVQYKLLYLTDCYNCYMIIIVILM